MQYILTFLLTNYADIQLTGLDRTKAAGQHPDPGFFLFPSKSTLGTYRGGPALSSHKPGSRYNAAKSALHCSFVYFVVNYDVMLYVCMSNLTIMQC